VATSRKYKNDHNGEYNKQSTWFNVLVGGPQAEFMANNAAKGNQVLVVGKFMPDRETGRPKVWTTKEGEPAASYDVLADMVRVLERRSDSEAETTYDDSIPF
jgi:single-stranded DNA-binding protein